MTRQLPRPLTGEDLLELAARAKVLREINGAALTDDEAFQLGEGIEIMASYVVELEASIARHQHAAKRTKEALGDYAPDTLVVDVPIAGGSR